VSAFGEILHRLDGAGVGFVVQEAHFRGVRAAVDQHDRNLRFDELRQLVGDPFRREQHDRVAATFADQLQQRLRIGGDPVENHRDVE